MDEILSLDIAQMAGISFDCSCGRKHSVGIRKISIGNNQAAEVARLASEYGKDVFLVADSNTYGIYGKKVENELKRAGFNLSAYIFQTDKRVVPDEKAIGRLLVEISPATQLIIAVGSGTINDLSRMLSYKTKIPYFIVGTAPSMDGYASTVSPLIIDNFKITYEANYPDAIFADTEIMKAAPMEMIHAGFGDIIGKYNALTDWVLSREMNGEYYCETCVKLVRSALQKCTDNIDGIVRHDEQAVKCIIDALILSGVAIGLAGNSRPASGAEHHMAHYWEIDALRNKREYPLHGNSVGVSTVVLASIYKLMKDKIPAACKPLEPMEISAILRRVGACDNPKALGISSELFRESVLHAKEIRPRYTILQYASDIGMLGDISNILTLGFYGAVD
jgi:glycerol-1-phosphate dehydrogenase [NAD(P)+]